MQNRTEWNRNSYVAMDTTVTWVVVVICIESAQCLSLVLNGLRGNIV